MNSVVECVVLVDENNVVLGTMPKSEVHTDNTPLHRGFSAFLFNEHNEFLLQQRSHTKKTWPLAWSNSCCGHPALDESNEDAARRRVQFELGTKAENVEVLSPYRYTYAKEGVMENEICPILVGRIMGEVHPNSDEVESVAWITWENFLEEIQKNPLKYSPWCREEAHILDRLYSFKKFRTT